MKRILPLLLILCLLLSVLPAQALAYIGDILPVDSGTVKQVTLSSGSLALQNDYLRVIARKDGTLSTAPAADTADPTDRQTPFCYFVTYRGYGYNKREISHPASLRLKSLTFVSRTPNGAAKAIRADYDLTVAFPQFTATGTTSVYYELVQLKENESSAGSWGVLVSVNNVKIDRETGELQETLDSDVDVWWGYTLSGFTGMGHTNAADSPAVKMSRTVYNTDTQQVLSTESSVITSQIEGLNTWQSFSQGRDWCYNYITEVYVDGYAWANPFVGLSGYYRSSTLKAYLPDTVSVTPASRPADTRVECKNDVGLVFTGSTQLENSQRFLWGFRNLVKEASAIPTKPDQVDPTIYAQRLAVFARGNGVTVLPVPDNKALSALKLLYGAPIAFISGDYESKNGTEFVFTGGAALLSPSVTATWDKGSGSLVIKMDGTVEQRGVHLSAPSFKFYQPKSGAENDLRIKLTKDGFVFEIDPEKNAAIVYVDIPYATVKLEQASADAAGNLVFRGDIGFQTIFEGAEFSLKKLGYGLNEKKEFKVNGVHATGSFDTAKLLALELAKVEGEVNTFKGEERYAFSLELNAFDLFETEATLALERSKKNGSLIPDELYFYVAASPGIPLIPPIPVGQLNGGGAGFKDLAKTVNGDYFAIPPLKLRGTLKGTYLHLIEAKGDVVLGPSEISLTASDVKLVGTNASVISSFGYSLKLNGQERNYQGQTYKGIYFSGSKALKLNLPNNTLDVIVLDTSIELGAFGGVNAAKDRVYLGVGANGIVRGRIQVPKDVPVIGGLKLASTDINLVVGGQSTAPIRGVSVNEGMKQAFQNADIYLGAMFEVDAKIIDVRVWVLVPQIVQTNFRRGGGWDVEHRWIHKLPAWNWEDHGVTPIVPGNATTEDNALRTPAAPMALHSKADLTVTAEPDNTPYIVLAFADTVTEEQIQNALTVTKDGNAVAVNWIANDEDIDPNAAINATTVGGMKKAADDGKTYRMAILRLQSGGTYSVDAGELTFSDEEGFAVEPSEKLELTKSGSTLSGEVKYPAENTSYVLRTYLGGAEGEADYLIEEQEVENPGQLSVSIPQSGALVPTGEYYVTSFLMTEKTFPLEDGGTETALMVVGSRQFSDPISYTNTNQPDAPASAALEFTGNEVLQGTWAAVENADGYRVRVYQEENGSWSDTGFGYDLDKNTSSVDMALTVGGEETEASKNLPANKSYKIGVSAYRTVEGGKYFSEETISAGTFLPEYTPLSISLEVNGKKCEPDEYGVSQAYVGGDGGFLAVTCAEADSITVTRMDTGAEVERDPLNPDSSFVLPDFTGSLMLRVKAVKGRDVTDAFLLVSVDETPPVLTLSDPVFFADRDTGEYTITGTADAGSLILYGRNESVYAAGDGSFTIPGTLEEGNSAVLSLSAQDGVGNQSAPQFALVARRAAEYTVTVTGSENGTASASHEKAAAGTEITLTAAPDAGFRLKQWQVVSPAELVITNDRFLMPEADVEIKAIFEAVAPAEFTVTFDGNGGTPSVGSMTTAGQRLASLPTASRSGYCFDGWYTEKSGGTKITTATVFSANTTVYAGWRAETPNPFTDVSEKDWFCGDVLFVYENGLMLGTGNAQFRPQGTATRGMMATIFWRMEGSPAPKSKPGFADVPAGRWYADAVAWTAENGIFVGYGENKFGPDDPITREQLATIFFRYADYKGCDMTAKGTLDRFRDAAKVSDYARAAMQWAFGSGLIQGKPDDVLDPQGTATRAEIAAILHSYLKKHALTQT